MGSFSFDGARALNEEIGAFLKNQNLLVRTLTDKADEALGGSKEDTLISCFKINQKRSSVCQGVTDSLEGEKVIRDIIQEQGNLQEVIFSVLDRNKDMPQDLSRTVSIMANQIEKMMQSTEIKLSKFIKSSKELSPQETEESIKETITGPIEKTLLTNIIPAILRGMKTERHPVNELILEKINNFLANIGIYTKEVRAGDKIDYDLCTATEDSRENFTENYELEEVIQEVLSYPYFFGDILVCAGNVKVWRLKK